MGHSGSTAHIEAGHVTGSPNVAALQQATRTDVLQLAVDQAEKDLMKARGGNGESGIS